MTEGLEKSPLAPLVGGTITTACVGGDYADDEQLTSCTANSDCSAGRGLCRVAGVPVGLCVGGKQGRNSEGQEKVCTQNSDCAPDGTCQLSTNQSKLIGYKGYCLETDSRSVLYGNPDDQQCLTWFPGRTNGTADLYNQFVEAGFDAGKLGYEAGPYYCTEAEVWSQSNGTIQTMQVTFDCDADAGIIQLDGQSAGVAFFGQNAIYSDFLTLKDALYKLKTANITLVKPNGAGTATCVKTQDSCYAGSLYPNNISADGTPPAGTCPTGFHPGKVRAATSGYGNGSCLFDTENYLTIQYECISDIEGPWLPTGIDKNPNQLTNNGIQKEERRCQTVYQMGESVDTIKAWTQNIWKAFGGALSTPGAKCAPYAASSFNKVMIPNMAIALDSTDCIIGTSVAKQGRRVQTYQSQKVYFKDSEYTNFLQKIFARSALAWELQTNQGLGDKVCYVNPSITSYTNYYDTAKNGASCNTRFDCSKTSDGSLGISDQCDPARNGNDPTLNPVCAKMCVQSEKRCRPSIGGGAEVDQYFDTNRQLMPCGSANDCVAEENQSAFNITCYNTSEHTEACESICRGPGNVPATQNETYQRINDGEPVWDVTASGFAPTVLAVGNCRFVGGKERCQEGGKGITVFANNQFYTGGIVPVAAGTQVSLRFFAFADNNQMPIRKLAVNWGDGDNTRDDYISGDPSYYRNQRGAKDGTCEAVVPGSNTKRCILKNVFPNEPTASVTTTVACVSNNDCQTLDICSPEIAGQSQYFGLLQDKTCNAGYYQFKNHVYECNQASENYCRNTSDPSQPNGLCNIGAGGGSFANGFCVFQPKVYAQDNWGWCTGTCNPAKGGCFAGGSNQCFKESGSEIEIKNQAWQVFGSGAGRVVVPADAPAQ
jgi:hypothetical protein